MHVRTQAHTHTHTHTQTERCNSDRRLNVRHELESSKEPKHSKNKVFGIILNAVHTIDAVEQMRQRVNQKVRVCQPTQEAKAHVQGHVVVDTIWPLAVIFLPTHCTQPRIGKQHAVPQEPNKEVDHPSQH